MNGESAGTQAASDGQAAATAGSSIASASGMPSASPRDVVFTFSTETFADVRNREFIFTADQALLALCRAKDRVRITVAANAWRSAPAETAKALLGRGAHDSALDGVTLVRPLRLRRRDPTGLSALRRSYRRYDGVLDRSVRRLGLDRPAVLTFNPFVAAFCPLHWASTVTYYAHDDWASFPPVAPWWPGYEHAYRVLRGRGIRVICVSAELATRVAADTPSVVLPNGIDESRWSRRLPPPAAVAGMRPPIVTYVGAIDHRLDVDLVAKAARADEVGSIALIGPVWNGDLADRLRSIPKVALCGPMSQAEIVGALMYSDACLIPHVVNPLTRAMSPLKLYEYLAAGKPVATTDLPPVRGISNRVVIASGDGFPEAVLAALRMPSQDEEERLRFVHSNSWAARHDRTIRVMFADDADWWKA
jgi:teichuronic acid biosynthesis glycosyltransferase TuaH